MGAFLFVNFVSACFNLAPVRCGFAVKARACALFGALALIFWLCCCSFGASVAGAVCTTCPLCQPAVRRFVLTFYVYPGKSAVFVNVAQLLPGDFSFLFVHFAEDGYFNLRGISINPSK